MATLWSLGKKSILLGVHIFSKLLIKSFSLKNGEPLSLFSDFQFEEPNDERSDSSQFSYLPLGDTSLN